MLPMDPLALHSDLSLRGPFCAVADAIAAENVIVESFMILDMMY